MPKAERQAFVFDACGGDEATIEAVLKIIDFEPPSGFIPDKPRSGLDLLGSKVDGYSILSHLGEGGSSVVYGVTRSDGYEADFALKLIRREFRDSDSIIERFRVEQEVLTKLQHSNVASLVDGGSFQGRPFFVMELVRNSRPITSYCQEQNLDLAARLRLFESTCDAVVHAHQQGIIHRDIKPANILIQVDPTTGVASPKLIDFGIAKAVEPGYFESMVETVQGEFLGTRSYASPEQIQGKGADTRTDVYGLGLVLYELLTDECVVDVSKRPNTEQLRKAICEGAPEQPSSRNTNSQRRIPRPLDWVSLMALEKSPSRRYQSVDVFLSDVRNARIGKRTRAQPRSLWNDLRTFIAEYTPLSIAITALAMSLLLVGWYAWRAHHSERRTEELLSKVEIESEEKGSALDKLKQAESDAKASLELSQKVNQALFNVISPPKESTFAEFEITHRERLRQATDEITSSVAGEPLVEAEVRWMLAATFGQYGDLDLAIREVTKSIELYEGEIDDAHQDTLRSKSLLADLLRRNGKLEEAYSIGRSVLAIRIQQLGHQADPTSRSRILLSDICAEMACYDESIAHLNAIGIDKDEAEWTDLAESVAFRLAERYRFLGNYSEASNRLSQVLEYQRVTHGENHPNTLATQYALAGLLLSTRRAEEAEVLYRDALDKLKLHAPDNLLVIPLTRDLAGAVSWQGRKRESESLLLETIFAEQRVRGKDQVGEYVSLCRYARLLRDRRAFDEAEELMRFVISHQRESHPDAHPATAASIETMASIYQDQSMAGNELYWQIRLLVAYLELYGLRHEATLNTAGKVLDAFGVWAVKSFSRPSSATALDILCYFRRSKIESDKRPIVVNHDGQLALEWSR